MMRNRRTSASVTPVAGRNAEDLRHQARPGLVHTQAKWDELERDGDESPGALHEKRVLQRRVRAAGNQSEHEPDLGDGEDMEQGFPDRDVGESRERPVRGVVDLGFDVAQLVGRRIGAAAQDAPAAERVATESWAGCGPPTA